MEKERKGILNCLRRIKPFCVAKYKPDIKVQIISMGLDGYQEGYEHAPLSVQTPLPPAAVIAEVSECGRSSPAGKTLTAGGLVLSPPLGGPKVAAGVH